MRSLKINIVINIFLIWIILATTSVLVMLGVFSVSPLTIAALPNKALANFLTMLNIAMFPMLAFSFFSNGFFIGLKGLIGSRKSAARTNDRQKFAIGTFIFITQVICIVGSFLFLQAFYGENEPLSYVMKAALIFVFTALASSYVIWFYKTSSTYASHIHKNDASYNHRDPAAIRNTIMLLLLFEIVAITMPIAGIGYFLH